MENKVASLNKEDMYHIRLILLIIFVTPFTSDSYSPSLPAIAKALDISTNQTQLTMTLYLFGVAISQLFYGPLSDRFGRRIMILIGLFICLWGSIFCIFAFDLTFILFARFVQGAGAGVCNSVFRAILRDRFTGHKMAQAGSYVGMFYTLALAIAPPIGGYIQHSFGWRANFLFVTIVVLSIFLMLAFYLPESHLNKDPDAIRFKNILRNYFTLFTSPLFLGYAALSSIAFSGIIAYFTVGPFLLQNIVGLTPVQFGWVSIGIAVGICIGQYINIHLVTKLGTLFLLWLGMWIILFAGLSMLAFGFANIINVWVIMIPIISYTTAAGLVFSNANANAFDAFGHIAGIAGAVYGFLQIMGSTLTSILIAGLHERTQVPLAFVFTSLGLFGLAILYFISRNKKTKLRILS